MNQFPRVQTASAEDVEKAGSPTMGKSMACIDDGWFDQTFVGEHLGLRWPDALRVAEYLTLFATAVDHRRQRVTSAVSA